MKTREYTVEIAASPEAVFDLIHDYGRRLDWDPFLREARLLGDATEAGVGVRALCTARVGAGGGAMETVYVSYQRPYVAAVKMTKGPPYIGFFAASLRQVPVGPDRTKVSYKVQVRGRPAWLAPILDPWLAWVFGRETRRRLEALRGYMEDRTAESTDPASVERRLRAMDRDRSKQTT